MKEKNVIPRIDFEPSFIYDRVWKELLVRTRSGKDYPSREEIFAYTRKMKAYWNKKKRGILEEMALVTHLKWRRTEIPCFVVGAPRFASFSAFSHPLTMHIQDYQENPELFLKRLIHELVHNLFIDNPDLWPEDYLDKKYGPESFDTKAHILVYALHVHIVDKYLNKKKNIVHTAEKHGYTRAWEIVKKEGYKNIIHDFVNYVEKKKHSNR